MVSKIEGGFLKERRQRLSLLFEGLTQIPHEPFSSEDDFKKSFWKNIHFWMVI